MSTHEWKLRKKSQRIRKILIKMWMTLASMREARSHVSTHELNHLMFSYFGLESKGRSWLKAQLLLELSFKTTFVIVRRNIFEMQSSFAPKLFLVFSLACSGYFASAAPETILDPVQVDNKLLDHLPNRYCGRNLNSSMILLCKPEIRRALLANGAKDSGELQISPHKSKK